MVLGACQGPVNENFLKVSVKHFTYSVMYSSVHNRVTLCGVKGALAPVDIGCPMRTSWGLSPLIEFDVLRIQ